MTSFSFSAAASSRCAAANVKCGTNQYFWGASLCYPATAQLQPICNTTTCCSATCKVCMCVGREGKTFLLSPCHYSVPPDGKPSPKHPDLCKLTTTGEAYLNLALCQTCPYLHLLAGLHLHRRHCTFHRLIHHCLPARSSLQPRQPLLPAQPANTITNLPVQLLRPRWGRLSSIYYKELIVFSLI